MSEIKIKIHSNKGHDIFDLNFCLGVSMNNPFFFRKDVVLLLQWISQNFHEGAIVIGDDLHRFNEFISDACSESDGVAAGRKLGDQFLDIISDVLSIHHKVIRWGNFYEDSYFLEENEKIHWHYHKDNRFKSVIDESCNDFINRQVNRGTKFKASIKQALDYSTEYVLEETAAFGIMNQNGYNAYIYPGAHLLVTKMLASGEFTNISSLIGMTLIEAKIQR